jgi:PAS domain S-box-containing protein
MVLGLLLGLTLLRLRDALVFAASCLAAMLIVPMLLIGTHAFPLLLRPLVLNFFGAVLAILLRQQRNMIATENRRLLAQSEELYRTIVESATDWIWRTDAHGRYTYASPHVRTVLGYEPEEIIGRTPFDLMPKGEAERVRDSYAALAREKQEIIRLLNRNVRKDGSEIILETSGKAILAVDGSLLGYSGIDRDVTERERMAERLRQSEKLEAIGLLAGGIAHDFNNQLAAIMGCAEMLKADAPDDPRLASHIDMILSAAQHSASLTRQMLSFARKGSSQRVRVDLHAIIDEVIALLTRTIDKRITIRRDLSSRSATTLGDPTLIENALLNLAINARDAMPEGGELTFSTEVFVVDAAFSERTGARAMPGEYVRVAVTDTGIGMDESTMRRIFEPFFTTKELGKGTGLGLSVVYGITTSHGGFVDAYSEKGVGSTLKLYLPLLEANECSSAEATPVSALPARIRVFVVDDEPLVAEVAARMLRSLDHEVTVMTKSAEAARFYADHWRDIDLVILDMTMPEMSGKELFAAMRAVNPHARVLLASGYSVNGAAQELLEGGVRGFLQKPYTRDALNAKIREVVGPRAQETEPGSRRTG